MSFKKTLSDFASQAQEAFTKIIEYGYDKDAPTWINEAHNRETAELAAEKVVPRGKGDFSHNKMK